MEPFEYKHAGDERDLRFVMEQVRTQPKSLFNPLVRKLVMMQYDENADI